MFDGRRSTRITLCKEFEVFKKPFQIRPPVRIGSAICIETTSFESLPDISGAKFYLSIIKDKIYDIFAFKNGKIGVKVEDKQRYVYVTLSDKHFEVLPEDAFDNELGESDEVYEDVFTFAYSNGHPEKRLIPVGVANCIKSATVYTPEEQNGLCHSRVIGENKLMIVYFYKGNFVIEGINDNVHIHTCHFYTLTRPLFEVLEVEALSDEEIEGIQSIFGMPKVTKQLLLDNQRKYLQPTEVRSFED